MRCLIFDIESNGLLREGTKLHIISALDLSTGKILMYTSDPSRYGGGTLDQGLAVLMSADILIGHNICKFDLKFIEKMSGLRYKGKVFDTFTLSKVLHPLYQKHSVEAYVKRLGLKVEKIQNEDWSVITQNMVNRCRNDVIIQTSIFKHLYGDLKVLHVETKGKATTWEALNVEQNVMYLHEDQVQHGVTLDQEIALDAVEKFDVLLKERRDIILEDAPKHLETPSPLSRPKREALKESGNTFPGVQKIHTQAGGYTAVVKRWFEHKEELFEKVQGPFCKVYFEALNPDSSGQVKDYLQELGWIPLEWNTVKEPDGSFRSTSPKLTEESHITIPEGLGKTIADYNTLKHRRNFLMSIRHPGEKGVMNKCYSDGRIPSEADTLGAISGRYTHRVVCNVPRPSSPYGEELRMAFAVAENNLMVGIDLSGIENRMLCHFCYKYPGGKSFAELVLEGDFHSANAELWGVERNTAKSILYAMMYGAGFKKLGAFVGGGVPEGRQIKSAFLKANKAYAKLVDDVAMIVKLRGYLIGIDGRKMAIRNPKDALNILLQGTSAQLFKRWMIEAAKEVPRFYKETKVLVQQVIAYHDELDYELYTNNEDTANSFVDIVCREATAVGEYFKLNIPIAADGKVGKNWADIH